MSSEKTLEKKSRLSSPTIYEIISREGIEELSRPLSSLGWSAVAAGVCICFSVFTMAYFNMHLPDDSHTLLKKFGYTAGFLIVILARLQLFTENTITVILPLLDKLTQRNFIRTLKLWAVVFLGNLAGTFAVAAVLTEYVHLGPDFYQALVDVSMHAVDHDFMEVFLRGIPAGFLIAVMVWMMPSAKGSEFFVIAFMIYLIALGDYSHVVAGSFEAFFVMFTGDISIMHAVKYIIAAGLGNILGGTGIFTLMAYAQVKDEI
jgi:formate/nitrite transporter FocA (FNT family)